MPDPLPDTIVPMRETGTRTPLFCVHPVSGSAYSYLGLAGLLGDDQPVYGFEAPGYDDDRQPARTLGELSEYYVSLLDAHWPDQPVTLLGWSLGGVVAYDMAQRLAAAGVAVPALVLVDVKVPYRAPLPPEKAMLVKFLHDLTAVAHTSTDAAPTSLADKLDAIVETYPADADPAAVFDAVERAAVLPEEVDAELLLQRYRIFRAHVAALFDFEVRTPYHGPVIHIRAATSAGDQMRWERVAPALREYVVQGDHHSMWTGNGLSSIAGIVADLQR
ncbi:thioesterase domain-containing protein [Actinokineospora baliensis]|uniref:thioesterase domain-containing protein n=1 Tax=Actinokineospora baliensis TaxID=547056 RepID=UPI001957D1E1|nr:alpha/beta fold hydrolase [Actinokineospora baliensis]MBM7774642.1 thioesterase domain-containing protein [Actinokineospora baliensis]